MQILAPLVSVIKDALIATDCPGKGLNSQFLFKDLKK